MASLKNPNNQIITNYFTTLVNSPINLKRNYWLLHHPKKKLQALLFISATCSITVREEQPQKKRMPRAFVYWQLILMKGERELVNCLRSRVFEKQEKAIFRKSSFIAQKPCKLRGKCMRAWVLKDLRI